MFRSFLKLSYICEVKVVDLTFGRLYISYHNHGKIKLFLSKSFRGRDLSNDCHKTHFLIWNFSLLAVQICCQVQIFFSKRGFLLELIENVFNRFTKFQCKSEIMYSKLGEQIFRSQHCAFLFIKLIHTIYISSNMIKKKQSLKFKRQ